jgi:GNAT superfamily N-acetyltransferase
VADDGEQARPATAGDIPRIVELAAELRAELSGYRGGELWQRAQDPPVLDTTTLPQMLDDDGVAVFAGCIDDAVVGYAIVREQPLPGGPPLAVITEIYVEPGAREIGVGEALVDAVLTWATTRACLGVDAAALPGHRAAKNFFEEHGFVARALTMFRALEGPA